METSVIFHVACLGFRGARTRYFKDLNAWELTPQDLRAKPKTMKRWYAEAPSVSQFVPPVDPGLVEAGFEGPDAEAAWARTVTLAESLGAQYVILRTPASFRPSASHSKALTAFFTGRPGPTPVWWAEGLWEGQQELRDEICEATGMIPVADPLAADEDTPLPTVGDIFYWRVHGRLGMSGRLSDYDLDTLVDLCGDQERSGFVVFTLPAMLGDAKRFAELLGIETKHAPAAEVEAPSDVSHEVS